MSHGAKIETEDAITKSTPLNTAASLQLADMVRLLLRYNPVVDATSCDGHTPLLSSCHISSAPRNIDYEASELLLRAGASVNARTNSGEQALHFAIAAQAVPLIKLLLNFGADVNSPQTEFLARPLHLAILHPEIVGLLLDRGAQVDSTSLSKTALHLVCSVGIFPEQSGTYCSQEPI